ncbi:MAG TPA: TonB family protein [Allosphingosinicella sp.]
MTEGAFYQPKKTSPTALAIVVLMHGAALTALAMAKMEVITKDKLPPIIVDFIDPKKPVEPPPPAPQVQPRVQDSVVTRTPPIIDMPAPPVETEWKPLPPVTQPIPEPGPVVLPRIDPPVLAEPRKVEPARARANLASYVSDEDYPSSAARNEEQGTTRFRLGVGPNGRVTECSVIRSSGSSALDSATCRLMKQRAKFIPARNSAGEPTSDSVTSAIRWVLPE